MSRKRTPEQRRQAKSKKQMLEYNQVLEMCKRETIENLKQTQNQRTVKHLLDISSAKVVKGKSRDVRNCPILLKEPGLPKEIADQNIRNFEARFSEQDLVLY